MRRAPTRASIALLLYLSWLTPAVVMLGVVLHDDHDDHGHDDLALDLAKAATHGHRHETTTPAHDHSAVRPAAPAAAAPVVGSSPLIPLTVALPTPWVSSFERRPAPTGSPPLFRSHCALLL